MNPLDIHLTTALDRQADHVRAVEATSGDQPGPAAARWLRTPGQAMLAFAVVAPVMLLAAWGLLAR